MSSEAASDKEPKVEEQQLVVEDELKIYRPDVDTTGIDERRLIRRIDWHVVPWLSVLYLLNFLDRGNIGNAKLYHMTDDLHITDKQYLIALTVLFFPYALFEPPSNLALKRVRPSIWLSSIMLVWGMIMTLHGAVTNYAGLVAVRFFLGLAEAGLYPGVLFYLSCWYKRNELGTRVAIFFSAATVAGAFSGLLAAAIQNMDGIRGRPGWAWIFILEGLITVLCAIASFFILSDFPNTAKFLNETERVWVIRRLQADMKFSAGGEKFKMKYIWQSLTDWKAWLAMGIYMGLYDATAANLLSVPVYVWACIMTVVIGLLGDRAKTRAWINLGLFGSGIAGYIILICSTNPALSYFAVYLAAFSIYPTIPNTVAWISSNVEGSYKRSVVIGMVIGWGNLNGAVSSNIYRATDAPRYRLGHGIVLAYIAIGWICSLGLYIHLRRENAAKERGERDEVIDGLENERAKEANGHFESIEAARTEKGDHWSGFRYSL